MAEIFATGARHLPLSAAPKHAGPGTVLLQLVPMQTVCVWIGFHLPILIFAIITTMSTSASMKILCSGESGGVNVSFVIVKHEKRVMIAPCENGKLTLWNTAEKDHVLNYSELLDLHIGA